MSELTRRASIWAGYAALAAAAYLLAFLIRFDFELPGTQWDRFLVTLPALVGLRIVAFWWFKLDRSVWEYVSPRDMVPIFKAVATGSLCFVSVVLLLVGHGFPRGVLALDFVLCLFIVSGARLMVQVGLERRRHLDVGHRARVLVVGAGDAGEMLMREVERNDKLGYEIIGLVDDDVWKLHRRIRGVEVLGTVDRLPELCSQHQIEEVLIAIPSANREELGRIVEACRDCDVSFKTVPSLNDLIHGRAKISQLHKVTPEDLIERDLVSLDRELLEQETKGKRILVTGAGGSIGSALCQQLAGLEPELLVLFERAESALYFTEFKLRLQYPGLSVVSVLGDILDEDKVSAAMRDYSPNVVYHAAAYKHVPLMETHPIEGVTNNVVGTEVVAKAALEAGVDRFVFISSDKAVNPVGVMGMTKRVGECLLLSFDGGPTKFVAVRFGNVLGSDGSVFPLFQWQIEHGGPVTVTDPEASRFFMAPSEAAQLVLQAGAMGRGGEVYFLDMGEPVKIMDLAENMIRANGLEPGRDVSIQTVGLRPGERLHEELFMRGEELLRSDHDKIFRVKNGRFDPAGFQTDLQKLKSLVFEENTSEVVRHLKDMTARN